MPLQLLLVKLLLSAREGPSEMVAALGLTGQHSGAAPLLADSRHNCPDCSRFFSAMYQGK